MKEKIEKTLKVLDTDRTNKLFESSIKSSDAYSGKPYGENTLKAARMTVNFGNLHVNTARTKISVIRLLGYRDAISRIKRAVGRKIKRSRRY